MSMEALRWAREPHPGLGLPACAVLVALCDRANDAGVCWPSVGQLAEQLDTERRTVQRALRRLEGEGLISTTYVPGRKGGNRYCLIAFLTLSNLTEGRHTAALNGGERAAEMSIKGGREVIKGDSVTHKAFKAKESHKSGAHTPETEHRPNADAYQPPDRTDEPDRPDQLPHVVAEWLTRHQ